jgi:hypothetical protein
MALLSRKVCGIPLYILLPSVSVLAIAAFVGLALIIEHRSDLKLIAEIDRTSSDLQSTGAEIASIEDGNLEGMNDYISAYAQVEPLQSKYDQKLQQLIDLYRIAQDRSSHRSAASKLFYGEHHPETWEEMSEIINLVQQISAVNKREISVVHAMASLPDTERIQFWHQEFMPLSAQEHALRERLLAAGRRRAGLNSQVQ